MKTIKIFIAQTAHRSFNVFLGRSPGLSISVHPNLPINVLGHLQWTSRQTLTYRCGGSTGIGYLFLNRTYFPFHLAVIIENKSETPKKWRNFIVMDC